MSENTLPQHTDTIPHFYALRLPISSFMETALPHTIATNELSDEITLLHLEDECRLEHLPSNGVMSGGEINPVPMYSDEWVAYGQTRGFDRYNLRTHEYKTVLICTILDELVKACRVVDAEKNIFAFMVAHLDDDDYNTRYFKVYDVSSDKPQLLSELKAGRYRYDDRGNRFVTRDSTLFYVHETENKLISLDFNLNPTPHPFTDAFNENLELLLETSHITVHSSLPFAIVVSTVSGVVSWKDGEKKFIPFPYIKKDRYVSEFSFSHDGKYLAWCSESTKYPKDGPPVYWYAEVNEKISGFIGRPVKLGPTFSQMPQKRRCTLWARNPTTFIVSEMEGLFWWHIE